MNIRLSSDEDMLRFQPNMGELWPRTDSKGAFIRSWDIHHEQAAKEIDRRLRASRNVDARFELGRVSARSREDLRDCAACFALHFAFAAADSGDPFYAQKTKHYWDRAEGMFALESVNLDYDIDNSGAVETIEQNQPFPTSFIRG